MPGGDQTGPMGMGPMTGRGAGYCNGFAVPGRIQMAGFAGGYGGGFSCGHGRGFRRISYAGGAPYTTHCGYPEYSTRSQNRSEEKAFLNDQEEFLENRLQEVRKRLSSLEEEKE